eukprot:9199996-Karenia_brevis.AAC.1
MSRPGARKDSRSSEHKGEIAKWNCSHCTQRGIPVTQPFCGRCGTHWQGANISPPGSRYQASRGGKGTRGGGSA